MIALEKGVFDQTKLCNICGHSHQVRKDGKGIGGWDDAKVDSEIAQDILAEEKVEVKKEAVQPPEDEPEAKADKKKPTGKCVDRCQDISFLNLMPQITWRVGCWS